MIDTGDDLPKGAVRGDRGDDEEGGNHKELLSDGHHPQQRQLVLPRGEAAGDVGEVFGEGRRLVEATMGAQLHHVVTRLGDRLVQIVDDLHVEDGAEAQQTELDEVHVVGEGEGTPRKDLVHLHRLEQHRADLRRVEEEEDDVAKAVKGEQTAGDAAEPDAHQQQLLLQRQTAGAATNLQTANELTVGRGIVRRN